MMELKPCPSGMGGVLYVAELIFTGKTEWQVSCSHCQRTSGRHATKAEAIEAWNRRAPVEGTAGEAERSGSELPEPKRYTQMSGALVETFNTFDGKPSGAWVSAKDYDALRAYATRPHALPAGWIPVSERLPEVGGTYLVGGWRTDAPTLFDQEYCALIRTLDGPTWVPHNDRPLRFPIQYWANSPALPELGEK